MSFKPERSLVQRQVDRIAASAGFAQAGRMNPLLAYLVDAAVTGNGRCVDQRAIAMDVLGRGADFDPESDAIVRAEVGRLRMKLAEYYAGPGAGDPLRIELQRGDYLPLITRRNDAGAALPAAAEGATHQIRYCRAGDGVSMAYSVSGAGFPVFLLPNWMSHLDTDRRNPMPRNYWSELEKRYLVIRFDCRGFGLSERNVPDYTLDTVASDLHLVADTLGLERFALFGPSGGAMIGTAYASAHPKRVSHLVMLGGSFADRA